MDEEEGEVIEDFPLCNDVLLHIFTFLDPKTLVRCSLVCENFNDLIMSKLFDNFLWKPILLRTPRVNVRKIERHSKKYPDEISYRKTTLFNYSKPIRRETEKTNCESINRNFMKLDISEYLCEFFYLFVSPLLFVIFCFGSITLTVVLNEEPIYNPGNIAMYTIFTLLCFTVATLCFLASFIPYIISYVLDRRKTKWKRDMRDKFLLYSYVPTYRDITRLDRTQRRIYKRPITFPFCFLQFICLIGSSLLCLLFSCFAGTFLFKLCQLSLPGFNLMFLFLLFLAICFGGNVLVAFFYFKKNHRMLSRYLTTQPTRAVPIFAYIWCWVFLFAFVIFLTFQSSIYAFSFDFGIQSSFSLIFLIPLPSYIFLLFFFLAFLFQLFCLCFYPRRVDDDNPGVRFDGAAICGLCGVSGIFTLLFFFAISLLLFLQVIILEVAVGEHWASADSGDLLNWFYPGAFVFALCSFGSFSACVCVFINSMLLMRSYSSSLEKSWNTGGIPMTPYLSDWDLFLNHLVSDLFEDNSFFHFFATLPCILCYRLCFGEAINRLFLRKVDVWIDQLLILVFYAEDLEGFNLNGDV